MEAADTWEGEKPELLMWVVYLEVWLFKYYKYTISRTDQEEAVKMRIASRGMMRRDPSDSSEQVMYDLTFFSEVSRTLGSQ